MKRLQWGHGDGAVEESNITGSSAVPVALQWGHGDGAVEEIPRCDRRGPPVALQWGHGDGAVEEAMAGDVIVRYTSFNGATAMEPWKRHSGSKTNRSRESFNGATAMEPWKSGRFGARFHLFAGASMGPRRWRRGRATRSQAGNCP